MIKLLVFCALTFFACSKSLTWEGNWYVLTQYSRNEGAINLPRNGTIASITVGPNGAVTLSGIQGNLNNTWQLPWEVTNISYSSCSFDYCTNGTLAQVNGVVYANISMGYSSAFYSVLMTPCDVNWLGNWFVLESESYEPMDSDVTVPEPFTYVDIEILLGVGLKMTGSDGNVNARIWPLFWDAGTTDFVNICGDVSEYTNVCANGNVTLVNWYLYATIEWNPDAYNSCVVKMVRLPPNVPTDVDLSSAIKHEDSILA